VTVHELTIEDAINVANVIAECVGDDSDPDLPELILVSVLPIAFPRAAPVEPNGLTRRPIVEFAHNSQSDGYIPSVFDRPVRLLLHINRASHNRSCTTSSIGIPIARLTNGPTECRTPPWSLRACSRITGALTCVATGTSRSWSDPHHGATGQGSFRCSGLFWRRRPHHLVRLRRAMR
jgi:hypothetical protein